MPPHPRSEHPGKDGLPGQRVKVGQQHLVQPTYSCTSDMGSSRSQVRTPAQASSCLTMLAYM